MVVLNICRTLQSKVLGRINSISMKFFNLLRYAASATLLFTGTLMAQTADPYLWLEEVEGAKALTWVKERNAVSEKLLSARPEYEPTRAGVLKILDSKDKIPYISRVGDHFFNFWQDANNKRGLLRKTTLDEYRKPNPAWETVLDIDALGKAENENWVYSGSRTYRPANTRTLISLSRGGADATVLREFDLVSKTFVKDGFNLPEAKLSATWLDADSLLVGTDFGPGSMTESGYPRIIKLWKRGTPISAATTVFEAKASDVTAGVSVVRDLNSQHVVFSRAIDFYRGEDFLWRGGKFTKIDKPDDASFGIDGEWAVINLRSDWVVNGATHKAGSLLTTPLAHYLRGERKFTTLFSPTPTTSLAGSAETKSYVILSILDNVSTRLEEWTRPATLDGAWTKRAINAPFPGTIWASELHDSLRKDDPFGESYFLNYTDFLTPSTLSLARAGTDARETLKSQPKYFDANEMKSEQFFATSKDGTRIPYFVVSQKSLKRDGNNPTLLYGYGGFEVSEQPGYRGSVGQGWLERGGVYVVANIRGGGEFGPSWHQAAIKANKQKSYDDFIAVAEELVAKKITQPKHLGIMGGSNGGLLVGATFVQRPDLFGAVVCQVPLLDMQRYHKLLAGASWMAEYGNPEEASEWAAIQKYSPYQNVKKEAKYPRVLFTTSTRDDRVHPAHARKMVARMMEQGHDVLYYENIEGGHGGAADNLQRAHLLALEYSYLWMQLR
jgi:prolyl oligopeptidase